MKFQKIKKTDYQSWADCIRSDQVPADRIYSVWQQNPQFHKWYQKKYLKTQKA